nr:hypothetical protein CFP56_11844 [Quercus suber]
MQISKQDGPRLANRLLDRNQDSCSRSSLASDIIQFVLRGEYFTASRMQAHPRSTPSPDILIGTMATRSVHLAKFRVSSNQRAHFAIFIPNAEDDSQDVTQAFQSRPCKGTTIQVLGEPLMSGFELQFERNYDCRTATDLQTMVFLGHVDPNDLHRAPNDNAVKETVPRAKLEREATKIPPPPRGQNIRLPIDGVSVVSHSSFTPRADDFSDQN